MIKERAFVEILKRRDDPLGVTRVSIIAGEFESGLMVNCEYHGTKEQALELLELTTQSMRAMVKELGPDEEPGIAPDDFDQASKAAS